MKIKTNELTDVALDWVVAVCENALDDHYPGGKVAFFHAVRAANGCRYSERWEQGGPIIERERITVSVKHDGWWRAWLYDINDEPCTYVIGPTALIAALRCYVTWKLGEEVEVPEELLK